MTAALKLSLQVGLGEKIPDFVEANPPHKGTLGRITAANEAGSRSPEKR